MAIAHKEGPGMGGEGWRAKVRRFAAVTLRGSCVLLLHFGRTGAAYVVMAHAEPDDTPPR
ncbi:hypothetical protein ABZT47_24580 [Sphaerisporangium sp. NPDC005289]|uniref:hypothetical protein n=1 Tax=Sphaerisporangium sp. NPDC005289 TaxID=3155247 RepID=UPI0033AC6D1B